MSYFRELPNINYQSTKDPHLKILFKSRASSRDLKYDYYIVV